METYLKKFQFRLKTTGPVFVGSGGKIHKKEYLFDRGTGVFSIINADKMFGELRKLGADRIYEDYLLKEQGDLRNFFRDAGISREQYGKWIERKLKASDKSLKGATAKEIMAFIRDGWGKAYIPGSSLKGALRTVLMNRRLKENNTQEVNELEIEKVKAEVGKNQSKKVLEAVDNKLDSELLHKRFFPESKIEDKVNSFMRGIIVSDSDIISDDDMCVCQKIDVDRFGKVRGKGLPLLRECIRQGVIINFTVTLDTKIFPYSMKVLTEMIGEFDRDYCALFENVFNRKYTNRKYTNAAGPAMILGGGAGFLSKTVNYSLFGRSEAVELTGKILAQQFKNHRHENDRETGLSPRLFKCTRVDGELSPMGECQLMKIIFLNKSGI